MQLRPSRAAGGCWPSDRHTLLLQAAAWDDERALEAWKRWREQSALERVTGADVPMLAAVYRQLRTLGADDPMLAIARGVYKRTWYLNQLALRRAETVVASLRAAGTEVLVLKGVALALLHYRDVGARSMEDIDLLVESGRFEAAIDVLHGQGWRDLPTQGQVSGPLRYGTHVMDADDNEIDLHAYALLQSVDDADLWETAVPLALGGEQTAALAPAEQLLHVCAHGMRWEGSTVRWAMDAIAIMRSSGHELDWERLVDRARARRLTVAVGQALAWLRKTLELEIPESAIRGLRAGPKLRFERTVHRMQSRGPTRLGFAVMSFDRYRRFHQLAPTEQRPRSFAHYLQSAWELPRRRELLVQGTRKLIGY